MLCQILKPFVYSEDGVTSRHAVAGRTCNIPTDLVAGLRGEGYIKPAPNQPVPAPVAPETPQKSPQNGESHGPAPTLAAGGVPAPAASPALPKARQESNVRPAKPGPTKQAPKGK